MVSDGQHSLTIKQVTKEMLIQKDSIVAKTPALLQATTNTFSISSDTCFYGGKMESNPRYSVTSLHKILCVIDL